MTSAPGVPMSASSPFVPTIVATSPAHSGGGGMQSVSAVVESLAEAGSVSAPETLAVLVKGQVAAGSTVTTISIVAEAPTARGPSEQVTVPEHEPWLGVADTNVTP